MLVYVTWGVLVNSVIFFHSVFKILSISCREILVNKLTTSREMIMYYGGSYKSFALDVNSKESFTAKVWKSANVMISIFATKELSADVAEPVVQNIIGLRGMSGLCIFGRP